VKSLNELVESGVIQLTRGKIISKKDIAACPGSYPIYSSAKDNDGKFGEYGKFLFDEELITWSVDGGGRLFHRPKHKFSVTNVGGVLRILDRSVLEYRYLYYALTLRHSEIAFDWVKKAHPSVIKKLYTDIPVPPLAEQRRIVGLLDEAFAGIAIAKDNAEKNYQNARAIFESHIQSVFAQRGKGWVNSNIGAEIRFIDYRGKTPLKTASGIRLITAKNVKMGYLQETPMEFIAADNYESWMTRGIPKKGDILFTTEAPLANIAQLDTDEKVAFAQRIIIMQPNEKKLDSTFLKYLLLSQPVQQRIRTKGTGMTVQGIKARLLKTIEISFPSSLDEQKKISMKLDNLIKETQRLARLYKRKLATLGALKQSLLQQAFAGEL